MMRDLFKFLLLLLSVFALALGAVRYFFMDEYAITGLGMIPTLMPGEHAFAWRDATITTGDITVCEHPTMPRMLVVGRVLAIAGDVISVDQGQLLVNERRIDTTTESTERFTNPITGATTAVEIREETLLLDFTHLYMASASMTLRIRTTRVPEGSVFLLGDNRMHSAEDSRSFGPVSLASCRGQIFMRNGAVAAPGPAHGRFDFLR